MEKRRRRGGEGRRIVSQKKIIKIKIKIKKRLRSASFEPSLSKSNSRETQLELISRFARSNSDVCVFRIITIRQRRIHFLEIILYSKLGWRNWEWLKRKRRKRRITLFTVGKNFHRCPRRFTIHFASFVCSFVSHWEPTCIRRRIKEIGNRFVFDRRWETEYGKLD